jgi:hypothetical protein
MKQRINAGPRFPCTHEEMKVAVQEEWDKPEPAEWNKYMGSIPQRIQQLKQRKGMQTEF